MVALTIHAPMGLGWYLTQVFAALSYPLASMITVAVASLVGGGAIQLDLNGFKAVNDVGTAAGVACHPAYGDDADAVHRHADADLYAA